MCVYKFVKPSRVMAVGTVAIFALGREFKDFFEIVSHLFVFYVKRTKSLDTRCVNDVNSAYFDNHGGYEFAKQFYEDAYQAAVQIVGGEQNCI